MLLVSYVSIFLFNYYAVHLDQNGDGLISPAELQTALKDADIDMEESDLKTLMEETLQQEANQPVLTEQGFIVSVSPEIYISKHQDILLCLFFLFVQECCACRDLTSINHSQYAETLQKQAWSLETES